MKRKIIILTMVLISIFLILSILFKNNIYNPFYFLRKNPICKNCNVILISIDTLSAQHLPCYGYERNTAPYLCQLAKDNILFSNSYSSSTWTLPSHMSIFTSLLPSRHQVITAFKDNLNPQIPTLTQTLKEAGYDTLYFGPNRQIPYFDQGITKDFNYIDSQYIPKTLYIEGKRAVDKLRENQSNGKSTFLFLHTYMVHDPYLPVDKYRFTFSKNNQDFPEILSEPSAYYNYFSEDFRKFIIQSLEKRVNESDTPESLAKTKPLLLKMKAVKNVSQAKNVFYSFPDYEIWSYQSQFYHYNINIKNTKQMDFLASLYDDSILSMDADLKEIIQMIPKEVMKKTIVVITSDHGEEFGQHQSLNHCQGNPDCLYNEIVKVPLIFSIPGIKNIKIDTPVQGIDIYPTIVNLVGAKMPNTIQGWDLSNLIFKKIKKILRNYIIIEQTYDMKAIVKDEWKLHIKNINNKPNLENTELYNIKTDPTETNNLADKQKDIVTDLFTLLKENQETGIGDSNATFPLWIDKLKREKLIKEGYF